MWNEVLAKLKHIVVAPGPSSKHLVGLDLSDKIIYSCGSMPLHTKVDFYTYGDIDHLSHIPNDPNCVVYSSPRNLDDYPGMLLFPESLPTAASSGGMAISLACHLSGREHVGLIGFDGFTRFGEAYNAVSISNHVSLIEYWTAQERVLVSLMDISVFNRHLISYEQYHNIAVRN